MINPDKDEKIADLFLQTVDQLDKHAPSIKRQLSPQCSLHNCVQEPTADSTEGLHE